MDLSKLPKLSESPPPPPVASGDPGPGDPPQRVMPAYGISTPNPWDLGFEVGISLLLGVIFLFMGINFGNWSIARMSGKPFITGAAWSEGNDRGIPGGTPVEYFDLQGGTAWSEMGFFVLGVALLLEAAILIIAMKRRRAGAGVFGTCMVLGVIGAIANGIAIVIVLKAGITPLISIVALFAAGFTIYIHSRYLFERPANA